MDTIRIFDQLIYNMDRSQENLLIGNDWRAYMIDHTRAFRKWPQLRNPAADHALQPRPAPRVEVAASRARSPATSAPYLTDEEIDG